MDSSADAVQLDQQQHKQTNSDTSRSEKNNPKGKSIAEEATDPEKLSDI